VSSALALALVGCLPAVPATLERLSLEEMIVQSTAIVRARAVSSRSAFQGPMIYTWNQVQVLDQWKGARFSSLDVATPGGRVNGYEQSFSGTPKLVPGSEYILFLWTGKKGMTHVIGLSQGLFDVGRDASGNVVATRAASAEVMLDPVTKQQVTTQNFSIKLSDLAQKIATTLGGAK
jgi:hypothetical protein